MAQARYMNLATQQQILIRLPEEVAARLKAVVPPRKRNKFVSQLVIKALEDYDRKLALIADQVTADEKNNPELLQEMRDWDVTVGDGIDDEEYETESGSR